MSQPHPFEAAPDKKGMLRLRKNDLFIFLVRVYAEECEYEG